MTEQPTYFTYQSTPAESDVAPDAQEPEAPGLTREEQLEALRRGTPDPRPNAGDFQQSTGGWVQTADGWVNPSELPADAWVKSPDGRWVRPGDLITEESDELQGKSLNPMYEGESERQAWRSKANPDGTSMTTFYASDEERAGMAATVDQGLLRDGSGAALEGQFGWVMDPSDGSLYVFEETAVYGFMRGTGDRMGMDVASALAALKSGAVQRIAMSHHSTPLAGRPVAGAGVMVVSGGQISSINDTSGHYRGEAEFLHQSLTELEGQGINLSSTEIQLGGADLGGRPGKKWLSDTPELDQEAVSLTWEQFQQTGGNEPQIRRKVGVNEAIGDAENAPEGSLLQRMYESAEASARVGYGTARDPGEVEDEEDAAGFDGAGVEGAFTYTVEGQASETPPVIYREAPDLG